MTIILQLSKMLLMRHHIMKNKSLNKIVNHRQFSQKVSLEYDNLPNPCYKCSNYDSKSKKCLAFKINNSEFMDVRIARLNNKFCGIGGKNFDDPDKFVFLDAIDFLLIM